MHVPLKAVGLSAIVVVIILLVPISFVSIIVKYLSLSVFILALIYILYNKFKK